MQVLESLFEKALKVEAPWKITKIEFQEEEKRLYIDLDFPEGARFACVRCGKLVPAYDTKIKTWRHLNFFQYECYLRVRMPRTNCLDDGPLRVDAPWARADADFTLLFESFAMTLCREMPVNTVSRIIGVDDNKRVGRVEQSETRHLPLFNHDLFIENQFTTGTTIRMMPSLSDKTTKT